MAGWRPWRSSFGPLVPAAAAVALVAAASLSPSPLRAAPGQAGSVAAPLFPFAVVPTPFDAVAPLLAAWRDPLPEPLATAPAAERARRVPVWLAAHDREIRARVARGDEDSIVNLWLFGTSFTSLPPARPADVAARGDGATLAQVIDRRLEDFARGLAAPGANTRLAFAAGVLADRGLDASAARDAVRIRSFLRAAADRAVEENARSTRELAAAQRPDPGDAALAYASLYRDRGLSTDTSILSSAAVHGALVAMRGRDGLTPGSIRRVAIVGPGLDVINKADGHDFYPEQSIQPFAVADSLVRLGLASPDTLAIAAFDVNERVLAHLRRAAAEGAAGRPYLLQLPLGDGETWNDAVTAYWAAVGQAIGEDVPGAAAPAAAGGVRVRGVRVRPQVAAAIAPVDLNVVTARLQTRNERDGFDLIVATNVFAYYDAFEQALAMTNLAHMLRRGGALVTNQAVRPVPPFAQTVGRSVVIYSDRQRDDIFWYRREP